MLEISLSYGIRVTMYYENHNPLILTEKNYSVGEKLHEKTDWAK